MQNLGFTQVYKGNNISLSSFAELIKFAQLLIINIFVMLLMTWLFVFSWELCTRHKVYVLLMQNCIQFFYNEKNNYRSVAVYCSNYLSDEFCYKKPNSEQSDATVTLRIVPEFDTLDYG